MNHRLHYTDALRRAALNALTDARSPLSTATPAERAAAEHAHDVAVRAHGAVFAEHLRKLAVRRG